MGIADDWPHTAIFHTVTLRPADHANICRLAYIEIRRPAAPHIVHPHIGHLADVVPVGIGRLHARFSHLDTP